MWMSCILHPQHPASRIPDPCPFPFPSSIAFGWGIHSISIRHSIGHAIQLWKPSAAYLFCICVPARTTYIHTHKRTHSNLFAFMNMYPVIDSFLWVPCLLLYFDCVFTTIFPFFWDFLCPSRPYKAECGRDPSVGVMQAQAHTYTRIDWSITNVWPTLAPHVIDLIIIQLLLFIVLSYSINMYAGCINTNTKYYPSCYCCYFSLRSGLILLLADFGSIGAYLWL